MRERKGNTSRVSSAVRAAVLVGIATALGCPADAASADHGADVVRFALIMAELRTAAERCPDRPIAWAQVEAERRRLPIADVDYFAFRKAAAAEADALAARLTGEAETRAWCAALPRRYGPGGDVLPGVLDR